MENMLTSLLDSELQFELQSSGNMIKLEPLELAYSNSTIDWDNNWIRTKICARGGVFSGEYIADIMTTDYEKFKQELNTLYDNLKGKAFFSDLEGALKLEIQGDGLGHFKVDVTVCDEPCFGAKLNFTMTFDQTYIKPMVRQMNEITKRDPIRGKEFKIRNIDL